MEVGCPWKLLHMQPLLQVYDWGVQMDYKEDDTVLQYYQFPVDVVRILGLSAHD